MEIYDCGDCSFLSCLRYLLWSLGWRRRGNQSCCVCFLSCIDAPAQESVRRQSEAGYLVGYSTHYPAQMRHTRHPIPPLTTVPEEFYQHTDSPPPMPSKALCLHQTIVAENKEPTKDQQKKSPNETPDSSLFCFPGPWGRSRGDGRLDSLRPAPGVLSLHLRGRLFSKEPVV